jgi:hypothetical protein
MLCRLKSGDVALRAMKHRDLMATLNRLTSHMKSNKPGSTNEQNAHMGIIAQQPECVADRQISVESQAKHRSISAV